MMQRRYRSFADQTQHYFTRPHEAVPASPLTGPSIWRGADLANREDLWLVSLSCEDADEIAAAAKSAVAAGYVLEDVDKSRFPLPTVAPKIGDWRHRIENGVGFVVVRGLPVAELSEQEAEMAFWGVGHHMGLPGAQNPDQELLGHVRDYQEAEDNPHVRLYRTAANIEFHCDAADVVGLLCLSTALSGGQSRIVSTGQLFNCVMAEDPGLVEALFEPFVLDRRGEGKEGTLPYYYLPPCAYADGKLRTFYHSEYMRSVSRHEGVEIPSGQPELIELYDRFGADPNVQLDMWLQPGDMQFLSNHSIAHARTAYEDDPAEPRHLLRLWLSLE